MLTDHLGSIVAVTDSSGAVLSQTRYLPFGLVRDDVGSISQTDLGYTGQRDNSYIKLYDYGSRWYDPLLGRFLQPDVIIPDAANPQAWNHFAYVYNNPINYNDPSGYLTCSDDGYCGDFGDTSYQKHIMIDFIEAIYEWTVSFSFTLKDIDNIYQTGKDIEEYVDKLTDGKGLEWMNEYLGGVDIRKTSGRGSAIPDLDPHSSGTIYLPSGFAETYFAHELGHIWDINTGVFLIDYSVVDGLAGYSEDRNWLGGVKWGIVGGVADMLNLHIGGSIMFTSNCRWCDLSGSDFIPLEYRWKDPFGYGNNSTADYLANSFAYSIYDPAHVPSPGVTLWVNGAIMAQAFSIP
ncbi:MAG: RHS repeat-associated core domain-containing protein [Chloroflexi bacterium]|nr:RHS repeat-associated core domain-containing protein [Chloroflexota bacterium]